MFCYWIIPFSADENAVDPEIARKIDIGFPQLRPSRTLQVKERLSHLKTQRANPMLEKEARAQSRKKSFFELKWVNQLNTHLVSSFNRFGCGKTRLASNKRTISHTRHCPTLWRLSAFIWRCFFRSPCSIAN